MGDLLVETKLLVPQLAGTWSRAVASPTSSIVPPPAP